MIDIIFDSIAAVRKGLGVNLSRLFNSDREKYDRQVRLADCIMKFHATPAIIAMPGMPAATLQRGKTSIEMTASHYNPDYFKAAAAVINAAESLGYSETKQAQNYPEGYKRLKEGSIEGVENAIRLAKDTVKSCSLALFSDNRRLTDLYRNTMPWSSHKTFGAFLGGAMTAAQIDDMLTEAARNSDSHAAPTADPFIHLRRPPSPGSAFVLSL